MRVLLPIIMLVFIHIEAYGQVLFALEGVGGIFSNRAQEHVLENNEGVSRLVWQDPLVPAFSLKGKVEYYGFFFVSGIRSAIPVQSGNIEDYDFLLPGSDLSSQYSQHKAYLDKHFDISAEAGYTIRPPYYASLSLFGGFLYRNYKWSAVDGFLQYPDAGAWTGNEPRQNITGPVISYEQAVFIPFIGVEIIESFFVRWGLSFKALYYPYIFAETIDTHFLRDLKFYDTLKGGRGGSFAVSILFSPDKEKKTTLFLTGGYELIRELSGTVASGPIGVVDNSLQIDEGYGSAMDSDTWQVMFGISLAF